MLIHTTSPLKEFPTEPLERIIDTDNALVYERYDKGIEVSQVGLRMSKVVYTGDAAVAIWAMLMDRAQTAKRHPDSYLATSVHERPLIVCLCGSTRFYKEFVSVNYKETMNGRIVLSVGFYPHAQTEMHGEQVGITPEQKFALDQLHKRKIDLADEIFVINVGGYVGHSTHEEIEYALVRNKPIRWLEPDKIPCWISG